MVASTTRDAYRLLIEQVIAGNGLSAVARLVADMAELPATVTDEDFEPLYSAGPQDRQVSADEVALTPGAREQVAFDIAGEPQASTSPPTLRVGDKTGRAYVVAPIVLPSGVVGYVWAVAQGAELPSQVDDIISHAAAACALEMVRQRAIIEGESRVRNSFLEDLLSGRITSTTSTRRRARFLGYDLRGEQIVFILDVDQFAAYVAHQGTDERGIQRVKERFRQSVEASLPAIWGRAMLWEHSDSIVALAPAGRDGAQSLRERVELLRASVERRLAGPSISAGVGRAYSDLTKLHLSYQEAEHALQIGTAFSGPSSTTTFDALGVYRLLFHLREQPELRAFCDETIGSLHRYDEEHGSHLLQTLACFLERQGNLSETARALHLHRNGLLYRLSRIEKIGSCDLNNPTQRLAMQIALLARPLLQTKHGYALPSSAHRERGG